MDAPEIIYADEDALYLIVTVETLYGHIILYPGTTTGCNIQIGADANLKYANVGQVLCTSGTYYGYVIYKIKLPK